VLSSAATCLWKSFRRSRAQFRDRPETVRPHPGTGVHLHPGILFEIIPEHRSESSRNRVHLARIPHGVGCCGDSGCNVCGQTARVARIFGTIGAAFDAQIGKGTSWEATQVPVRG